MNIHDLLKSHPTAEQILDWICHVVAMIHIGLATSILIGGQRRFSNPSLHPLSDLVDGRVWIWGSLIFISGALMISPFRVAAMTGLWLGMMSHFFWMACFAVAITHAPNAAATTIPVYGGLALICTVLLTAKVLNLTMKL